MKTAGIVMPLTQNLMSNESTTSDSSFQRAHPTRKARRDRSSEKRPNGSLSPGTDALPLAELKLTSAAEEDCRAEFRHEERTNTDEKKILLDLCKVPLSQKDSLAVPGQVYEVESEDVEDVEDVGDSEDESFFDCADNLHERRSSTTKKRKFRFTITKPVEATLPDLKGSIY